MVMKKINRVILFLFFCILLTAKPADAKVYKDAFNRHRDVYDNGDSCTTLYDTAGNVYLRYRDEKRIILVSTPDAKNGSTTLVIPDSVQIDGNTYYITAVGTDDVDDVEEVVFSIGEGYKKIVFGKNVTHISAGTFGCGFIEVFDKTRKPYNTLEEIQFLGNDITIDDTVFLRCENLKQVTGSENITFIGSCAFAYTAITHFNISYKCAKICSEAFLECKRLKELPDISRAKVLGRSIFTGCSGLKKILLPEGLKELPNYTFSDCENVKEVYIPKSVKKIGREVFHGCTKLKGNVTIDPKNKYFSAKDNMILNKKGDTLLSMISPAKVMVIPSYIKKVNSYWAQSYIYSQGSTGENRKYLLRTIIIQNKDIVFNKKHSVPCWYSPGVCKQKINILYPNTRGPFAFTKKQLVDKYGMNVDKYSLSKSYNQRPYTLHPAPTRVKAKLKKGRVQITFKKLKNATVKKHKITYRIKKNGKYKAQKEKVIKGTRATLCSLQKGEICEVRVSAYTKQGGVWLPGKFSRMVKVRGKA